VVLFVQTIQTGFGIPHSTLNVEGGTTLTIGPGVTLSGQTVDVGGTYSVGGTTSIVNRGLITANLPNPPAAGFHADSLGIFSSVLVNYGTIEAKSGGTLDLDAGSWSSTRDLTNSNAPITPAGTFSVNSGTLNLGGSFTTADVGTFSRIGGTVQLTGSWDDTAATADLNASSGGGVGGDLVLQGGLLKGGGTGTLMASGSGKLVGTGNGGSLQALTLAAPLDMTGGSALVHVQNGLVLNATITVSSIGHLVFDQSEALTTTGTAAAGNQGVVLFVQTIQTGFGIPHSTLNVEGGTTLTIGPGVTVSGQTVDVGGPFSVGGITNIVNQGLITANLPNPPASGFHADPLGIVSNSFTNIGTLEARNGGTLDATTSSTNFSSGTLSGGTWQVFANSTLRLINSGITTNAATIILDGPNSNFYSDAGTTSAFTGLTTNAAVGTFTVRNGRTLTTAGAFTNNGRLVAGPAGEFQVAGNYTQSGAATLETQLGGSPAGGQFGQLVATGGATTLDGTLRVPLVNGFTPLVGDQFTVLADPGSSPVTGIFAGLPEGATFISAGYQFQITYAGGASHQDVILTVTKVATTTSVTSSANPSNLGQSVTFTATVGAIPAGALAPTGSVQFQVDGVNLGSAVPLTGNSASITTAALTGGLHTITALYSGDAYSQPSSANLTQNVVAVTASAGGPYSITYGSPLTLDAFASSGAVNYNWTINGHANAASGVNPTLSWSQLAALGIATGQVDPVSVLVDDGHGDTATAQTTLTVTKATASISITPYSGTYDGQFHGLSGSATGVLGEDLSALLNLGITERNAGHYNVAWSFAGNNNYYSASGTSTIDIAQRTLHVSATADSKVYDGTTIATAHLSDDRFAGDVFAASYVSATFSDKNVGTGKTVTVNGISISGPDAGNYNLVSTTATTTADITPAATSTTLTGSAATPLFGDTVTFSVTVTGAPGDFTGGVDFFDSTTQTDLGGVALNNGTAALSISTLALGAHTITATYSGDGNHLSSSASTSVTVIPPASLSGVVFEDFNNDGQVDFGEPGIAGVTITLTGTDDLGHAVSLSQTTDSNGLYSFTNLRPANYTLTETQPTGYTQGIDTVGTAGGSLVATDTFSIQLGQGVNGLNYNYGEEAAATGPVQAGQTASVAFWKNNKGQALILALNGGPTSTQLGNWLAATLPNIYGSGAGGNNLAGMSNADIAALFQLDVKNKRRIDAQVLATSLSVYATNATLDPTMVAAQYGFTVSGDGVGTATVNVGSNGAAFGVANNTTMTVMDLLLATNAQAVNGVLYNGDTTLLAEAYAVYRALNAAGGIN
jgi:hypothetical protein